MRTPNYVYRYYYNGRAHAPNPLYQSDIAESVAYMVSVWKSIQWKSVKVEMMTSDFAILSTEYNTGNYALCLITAAQNETSLFVEASPS